MTRPAQRDDGTHRPLRMLGAVVDAAVSENPVRLEHGPVLVTTRPHTHTVLTGEQFVPPFNVSRRPSVNTDPAASGPHRTWKPLDPGTVAHALEVFSAELDQTWARHTTSSPGPVMVSTTTLLRDPVTRAAAAAALPSLPADERCDVAARAAHWVDTLAPVIAARRPPRRWSRTRRQEARAHRALLNALRSGEDTDAPATAAFLAAGTQVPIAAGAWLLVTLAERPDIRSRVRDDTDFAVPVVWELLRLHPPTWLLPRLTTDQVTLGDVTVEPFTAVLASPLLLGRRADLIPGPEAGHAPRDVFDPQRWTRRTGRPGGWLPFGLGPHACPGRNLAMAQLTHLAQWAATRNLRTTVPVTVDARVGLRPYPDEVVYTPAGDRGEKDPGGDGEGRD